jgi:hypothetical protein
MAFVPCPRPIYLAIRAAGDHPDTRPPLATAGTTEGLPLAVHVGAGVERLDIAANRACPPWGASSGARHTAPAKRPVLGQLSPPNAKSTGERLRDFTAPQAAAILAFLRVFEMRERIENAASEETLEWAAIPKPLTRAIKYWTARAEPAGV